MELVFPASLPPLTDLAPFVALHAVAGGVISLVGIFIAALVPTTREG